jgi:hypothetical protein
MLMGVPGTSGNDDCDVYIAIFSGWTVYGYALVSVASPVSALINMVPETFDVGVPVSLPVEFKFRPSGSVVDE